MIALQAACLGHGKGEGPSNSGAAQASGLSLDVKGAQPGFADNSVVMIEMSNPGTAAVTVNGLAGEAFLVSNGGAQQPIHEISLGVAKPIVVPPGATIATSLLFHGDATKASAVKLLGQTLSIPQGKEARSFPLTR